MMRINIGTKNKIKIEAVKEVISGYDNIKDAEVNSIKVDSEIAEQPIGLKQIFLGAKNRAKNGFDNCEMSVGIESGFMHVDGSNTGMMEITGCAIFDGEKMHYGVSPGFECPQKVMELVHKGNDLSKACKLSGLSDSETIGEEEGIIGILTKKK